jgi:hypothetical protein
MFKWPAINLQKTNQISESSGAYDGGATGAMTGIIAGTSVATSMGWRDVVALQEGDMVLTFDGGLQQLKSISRSLIWNGRGDCPKAFWPLQVPKGALENAKEMQVLPRQGVMLESDIADEVLGDPFALIPAAALEGVRGIERVYSTNPVEVITLGFEDDQIVFAEQGALLFCAAGKDIVQDALMGLATPCPYKMLSEASAIHLARGLETRETSESCLESFRAALTDRGAGDGVAA